MRPRTADVRRRRPALVAAVSLPVVAAVGLTVLAARDGGTPAPAATPTTAAAPADTTAPSPVTAPSESVAESAPATAATARFADGQEARSAAEGLIPAYISSQFDLDVTDPACSKPETGAAGEEFVCYALKPGDLVIALRATVGEERLITLTLITDQQPTTTTTTPVATTIGG